MLPLLPLLPLLQVCAGLSEIGYGAGGTSRVDHPDDWDLGGSSGADPDEWDLGVRGASVWDRQGGRVASRMKVGGEYMANYSRAEHSGGSRRWAGSAGSVRDLDPPDPWDLWEKVKPSGASTGSSMGSVGSVGSSAVARSALSAGSMGSALSAGSMGSALSAGSMGSALSAGSTGFARSARFIGSAGSSVPEASTVDAPNVAERFGRGRPCPIPHRATGPRARCADPANSARPSQQADPKAVPPLSPAPRVPYSQIETVFNQHDIWIPCGSLDPAAIRFDLNGARDPAAGSREERGIPVDPRAVDPVGAALGSSSWIPYFTPRLRLGGGAARFKSCVWVDGQE